MVTSRARSAVTRTCPRHLSPIIARGRAVTARRRRRAPRPACAARPFVFLFSCQSAPSLLLEVGLDAGLGGRRHGARRGDGVSQCRYRQPRRSSVLTLSKDAPGGTSVRQRGVRARSTRRFLRAGHRSAGRSAAFRSSQKEASAFKYASSVPRRKKPGGRARRPLVDCELIV